MCISKVNMILICFPYRLCHKKVLEFQLLTSQDNGFPFVSALDLYLQLLPFPFGLFVLVGKMYS